ncbi:MAG: hypothetical protein ACRDNM_07215 [Gaiellaceae bacterium]
MGALAPREIEVVRDESLWLAIALYREGVNSTSSIYRCLCFKNVLDAVFNVEHETVRPGVATPEAAARDTFINNRAGRRSCLR